MTGRFHPRISHPVESWVSRVSAACNTPRVLRSSTTPTVELAGTPDRSALPEAERILSLDFLGRDMNRDMK